MTTETLASLRANLHLLTNPRDQADAQSLLNYHDRVGFLTPRQSFLVDILGRRAANSGGTAPRARVTIGALDAINALFDRAKSKLKQPSLVIADAKGARYRLRLASARARIPGSIDVISVAYAGQGTWYGRILDGGVFEASPRVQTPPELIVALTAFAADPAHAAGVTGKATGQCCFCSLPIGEGDDPRARSVGYGEVCAGHWGLPFPSKSDARASNAAMLENLPKPRELFKPTDPFTAAQREEMTAPIPGAPRRPAGVCAKCADAGHDWETPCVDGTCYQCGGAI
jgi:hypothetical protein